MKLLQALLLSLLAATTTAAVSAAGQHRSFSLRHLTACYGSCSSHDDCDGQLACINGQCNDDPEVGTSICHGNVPSSSSPPPPSPTPSDDCKPQGYINGKASDECNTGHMSDCCKVGERYPKFFCSPPVSSATKATLTLNGFGPEEDGGGAASCDGKFHSNEEKIVAMSTGWFKDSSRCFKQIEISANGRRVKATVIDECDSRAGCDATHAYQPPCRPNIVDASNAVWEALGIGSGDERYGYLENITWRDV